MQVLEAGEVAAYDDQVQLLAVLDGESRTGVPSGPRIAQRNLGLPAGGVRAGHEIEGVAVLGNHQSSGDLCGSGGVGVLGSMVIPVSGGNRGAERDAHPGGSGEHRR